MTATEGSPVFYEHERFAFLDEATHDHVAGYLGEHGVDLGQDDKTSHFFVLPERNLSVATTVDRAVIKLKVGQVGNGAGFEEVPEVELAEPSQTTNAVTLLRALTDTEPQVSHQIRHNYRLDDVELALKYTETWGFHLELECLYEGGPEADLETSARDADTKISAVAGLLGIKLATDAELTAFKTEFEATGNPRGEYDVEEMRLLYGSLYKLAAMKRLPRHQVLDSLTVEWITQNRPDTLSVEAEKLAMSDSERRLLSDLSLPTDWFSSEERKDSLHGQLHLARVASYASHLARQQGRSDQESRTLFVAGLLHDIRRAHDQTDSTHAQDSAAWFRSHEAEVTEYLGTVADGIDLEMVYETIYAHDDARTEKSGHYEWAIQCLKTADALDRYRQPKLKWWIDDSRLRIVPDSGLKACAFEIVVATERKRLETGDLSAATAEILQTGAA